MHNLPDLPYNYSSLEPYIDEQTMHLHHQKHHAGYVKKLNDILAKHPKLQKLSIEDLLKSINDVPESIRQSVINNGGGHANHTLFWQIMSPDGKREPEGDLKTAINKTFGGFQKFKEEFTQKSLSVFGSGWVFLIIKPGGILTVKRHSFQNSPIMHGNTPILGLDLWEHAYYLKYQNQKAKYIEAWWNIVDWEKVEKLYQQTVHVPSNK